MLGKRIINTATGAACTTDTVQILDGVPFQSIATYELDGDATNLVDTGYIGKAGVFNGSSSVIDFSQPLLINTFSVSFFIKTSNSSAQRILGNPYGGAGDYGFNIRTESSTGHLEVEWSANGTNAIILDTGQSVIDGNWHHIVAVWSNGSQKIYIDNVEEASSTNANDQYATTDTFKIGANWNNTGWFNGSIDQVRIFNKALSSSEVTTLYGETSASSTKSTTDIFADSSGISLYEFEGNANDTGGNYNGTATNVVYNEYDGTASNVTYSTGKFGQAGVFNGSSSGISTNLTTPNTQDLSWSFWVKDLAHNGSSTMNTLLLDYKNNYAYINYTSSNTLYANARSSSTNADIDVQSSAIDTSSWRHIVFVSSLSSGSFLYIDGSLVDSNTTSMPSRLSINYGSGLEIGWNPAEGSPFTAYRLNGKVDQVRIYDKAISASDVTTLYNETVATASTNITLEVPSLVAYYKMNDATDETGSYDGTPTNVNFNVAGKFGNAGEFNGGNSIITLANTPSLSQANNFTWSYWVKPNGFTANGTVFRLTSHSYTSHEIRSNGIIFFYWGTGNSLTTSSGVITDGVWQHVAITKSSTSGVVIYVNGVSVATSSNTDNAEATTATNRIGGWDGTNYGFLGSLDQVRIFDRAITSDEVETLYNEVYCQPTIVPTDHFEPVLYTGNGSSQSISTLDFAPDFVWIKCRSDVKEHILCDSVRGVNKELSSDNTYFEESRGVNSFDTNGFTLDGLSANYNGNNESYVAWNWKSGGADVQNTDGTITSQVSANQDAGFSIVKHTAPSSEQNYTIGHGLSQKPDMVILKGLDSASSWFVWHKDLSVESYYLYLNGAFAESGLTQDTRIWGQQSFTDTVISTRSNYTTSLNQDYISYCFHSVDGYQKVGSYTGNATTNVVTTGFQPKFLLVKASSHASSWYVIDSERTDDKFLSPNSSNAEYTDANKINFTSTGFTLTSTSYNNSGYTWIYLAIA